jgi:hypothetical protein
MISIKPEKKPGQINESRPKRNRPCFLQQEKIIQSKTAR